MFAQWDDPFPTNDHLWMKGSGRTLVLSIKPVRADGSIIKWAKVADAKAGSTLYDDIVAWGEGVRTMHDTVYVVFHHEPEAKNNIAYGTAADYRRAWARVVEIFRDKRVGNARFLWTMTDLAFSVASSDRRAAAFWYPGDGVVDAIGADVYNWFDCAGGTKTWQSFASLAEPVRAFGQQHPDKPLFIPEFGSVEDPAKAGRKAAWIRNATATLLQPDWKQFAGAMYFNYLDPGYPRCKWQIDSSPDALAAFAEMARANLKRP